MRLTYTFLEITTFDVLQTKTKISTKERKKAGSGSVSIKVKGGNKTGGAGDSKETSKENSKSAEDGVSVAYLFIFRNNHT